MAYVYLSDLGQSTNRIQADNAYGRGRVAVSRGDLQTARLSLSELQFTYNNARNAGDSAEAAEIWRLYGLLKNAIEPGTAPVSAPSAQVTVDMSATKAQVPLKEAIDKIFATVGIPAPTPGAPSPVPPSDYRPARGPNYLLWGAAALGVVLLAGAGIAAARNV